jgi:hypothetical protein
LKKKRVRTLERVQDVNGRIGSSSILKLKKEIQREKKVHFHVNFCERSKIMQKYTMAATTMTRNIQARGIRQLIPVSLASDYTRRMFLNPAPKALDERSGSAATSG